MSRLDRTVSPQPLVQLMAAASISDLFIRHAAAYYRDESKRRGMLSPRMSKGVHPDFLRDAKVSNSAGKFHLDGAVFATRETHDGLKPLISA